MSILAIDCLFIECLANALGKRSMNLRVREMVVEYGAAIINCHVVQDMQFTRLAIDFDDREVGA